MNINDCQREMRVSFLGGFAGQMVSGLIWLGAAAASTWMRPIVGMLILSFGSMLIFPLTQGLLRLMGYPAKTSAENKLWGLGGQIAFTVPINFSLVAVATLYHQDFFFPAAMIVVGAHYLPFVTLYGMEMFGLLAGLLVLGGIGLGMYDVSIFSLGGWVTAVLLIVFAFVGRHQALREIRKQ